MQAAGFGHMTRTLLRAVVPFEPGTQAEMGMRQRDLGSHARQLRARFIGSKRMAPRQYPLANGIEVERAALVARRLIFR